QDLPNRVRRDGGGGGGAQAGRGVETDTPQATAGGRGDQGRAGAGQDQCVTDRLPADQLGVLGAEFQLLVECVPGMAGDGHQAVLGGLVDRVGGLDAYDQGADEPALLFKDALGETGCTKNHWLPWMNMA